MGAIVGAFHAEGGVASAVIPRGMLAIMPHRCMDGGATWEEGLASLGCGMRFTTPESLRERLPLRHPDIPVVIAFDGRLDNREDLIRALRTDAEITDGALALEAYVRWETECARHLIGDFAVAVWDGRNRHLFCARDVFGACPLYYTRVGPFFGIASEMKAFGGLPGFEPEVNEVRVADILAVNPGEGVETVTHGVFRLPAAHVLTLDLGRGSGDAPSVRRYYTFEARDGGARRSDDDYAAELRERLEGSVRAHLRSSFPVGVQLSGGLDSSSISVVARDVLRQEGRLPLKTFSLTFESFPAADELEYVAPIVAQGGLEPHYVPGDRSGPIGDTEALAPFLDDGPGTGTQNLVCALLRTARKVGVRVMLDGIDGDNAIMHGEVRLHELMWAGDWGGFLREARALSQRYATADHRQNFEDTFASERALKQQWALSHLAEAAYRGHPIRFLKGLQAAHHHTGISRADALRRFGRIVVIPRSLRGPLPGAPSQLRPSLVHPDLARRVGLEERIRRGNRVIPATSVREAQAAILGSVRVASAIELAGHYAAALGMELRHPFFDRRLLEFTLSLPSDMSLRDGWTRYVLRKAMSGVLPDKVAWRVGKASMRGVHERGLLVIDRNLVESVLSDMGPIEPYVNVPYVRRLASRLDRLDHDEQLHLDILCNVALWFRARMSSDELKWTNVSAA
jgi:asparagine synthase (glutamine-hydrolysing)